MTAAIYNLLLVFVTPLAALYFTWRQVRRGRLREGWGERFGRLPASLVGRCRGREVVWVHAVSVGETIAAKPLLAELRRRRPKAVILLSQITETGRETARSAGADGLLYLPLDAPPILARVIDQLRPKLLVVVDTELWPNLFWVAHQRGVRTAVVNGRISDRSLRQIRKLRLQWLYRWTLSNADRLLMQSERDARHVLSLGAPTERVTVSGNLKIDEATPEVDAERLAWWRSTLGLDPEAPVLLAGSTGPGEEAILLEAYAALRQRYPSLRLVLILRAIDRAAEVLDLVAAAGLAGVRRSELPAKAAESRARGAVIVGDTIGELSELYAVGTVTFVGRSLVPLGGSNVLQAAAQGKVVLTGPHVQNVRDSVALLTEAGVCRTVTDAASLAAACDALLADAATRERLGAEAQAVIRASRGATARTAEALVELLDG